MVSYASHILDVYIVRISGTRLNVLTVDFRSRAEFPKTMWVMSKTVFTQTPPGL